MSKVETQLVVRNKLTCLLNVSSENLSERRLQKVSRRVVSHNVLTSCGIDTSLDICSDACHTLYDFCGVENDTVVILCRCEYLSREIAAGNNSCVACLSAALGIKCRFVKNYNSFVTLINSLSSLSVFYDSQQLCVIIKAFIAKKFSFCNIGKIRGIAYPSVCACIFSCISRSFLLLCKKLSETILVNGKSVVGCNFLCKIYRESIRIAELESVLSADDSAVSGVHNIL